MSTTKIVELFIDDEYEESGIEAISLVSRPAHDEPWMAFNSQLEQMEEVETLNPYTIVEDDFCDHNPQLDELGESYSDLIKQGWEVVRVEKITPSAVYTMQQEKFSNPNADSQLDTGEIRVRYKYIGPRDEKNRKFCADMLRKNRVYTIEDIERLSNPEFGSYNIFLWRGSFNCRHAWVRLVYKKEGKIINDSKSTQGLITEDVVIGPDTRNNATKANPSPTDWKPGEPRTGQAFEKTEKSYFAKISIDYDETLSTKKGFEIAKELINNGADLYIISARSDKSPMLKRAEELGIPTSKVFATGSNKAKVQKVKELGITKHIDNSAEVIKELGDLGQKFADFISENNMGLEDACWEGYEAIGTKIVDGKEVPNCVPIKMTEDDFADSISDYPEGVKAAAARAVKYAEENGWGSCGTGVGKQRASQLSKGENISVDTIKRMYSYLSRHKGDLETSKDYKSSCGKLMYDAWGGEAGLKWAERKLQQLEKQKMTFAYDEDKKILIGAAMVPNRMIHRYDALGNLYYVFFSKKSIKKMADRFLKQKRTDETSIEHNGKKLGSDKVFITESWVSEDPIHDKSFKYGFELPSGTWFVAMKVNDDKVWKLIKEKALTGFSVEGLFAEKSIFSKEDKQINQIKQILKSINDE